jgi:hypothetical protein
MGASGAIPPPRLADTILQLAGLDPAGFPGEERHAAGAIASGGIFIAVAASLPAVNATMLAAMVESHFGDAIAVMLKEVMLGSGGILLAAAIVASSMPPTTPAPEMVPAVHAPAVPVAQAAPPPPPPPPPVQAEPDMADGTGDKKFGAPMIDTTPVEKRLADAPSAPGDTGDTEPSADQQFNAVPGSSYPVPR